MAEGCVTHQAGGKDVSGVRPAVFAAFAVLDVLGTHLHVDQSLLQLQLIKLSSSQSAIAMSRNSQQRKLLQGSMWL